MRVCVAAAAMAMLAVEAGATDDARLKAYGEHLSSECTTCHRIDGVQNGIPSIVGWPVEDFLDTLKTYQDGARSSAIMVSVAQSLDERQMQALGLFFGTLKKAR